MRPFWVGAADCYQLSGVQADVFVRGQPAPDCSQGAEWVAVVWDNPAPLPPNRHTVVDIKATTFADTAADAMTAAVELLAEIIFREPSFG